MVLPDVKSCTDVREVQMFRFRKPPWLSEIPQAQYQVLESWRDFYILPSRLRHQYFGMVVRGPGLLCEWLNHKYGHAVAIACLLKIVAQYILWIRTSLAHKQAVETHF